MMRFVRGWMMTGSRALGEFHGLWASWTPLLAEANCERRMEEENKQRQTALFFQFGNDCVPIFQRKLHSSP
jgi:hypothetical protein